MKPKKTQINLPASIAVLVGLGLLDLALLGWLPYDPGAKVSLWAVAIVSFFLMILLGILSELMDRRLARDIRALSPASSADSAPPPARTVAIETTEGALPVPPFAVAWLNADSVLDARAATRFIEQGRQRFDESILILRRGIRFLWRWNIALLVLGLLFTGAWPISIILLIVLFCAAPVVRRMNPEQSRTLFAWFAWAMLNLAWLGVTVYALGFYTVRLVSTLNLAAVPPILLAGIILWKYLRTFRHESQELRRKVQSNRPVKLLFLWVFGSPATISNSLINGVAALWRFFGSMQLLRGSGLMGDTSMIVPALTGRSKNLIVKTHAEVSAQVRAFKYAPHWTGMYGMNMLLCHDRVWQFAVQTLLVDTDVVLMDLSGFTSENQGCIYELGQLIDKLPTPRFVLLIGDTTQIDFLLITLGRLWADMAATSPNRHAASPIQLFRLNDRLDLLPMTLQRPTNPTQVSWREFQEFVGAFNVARTAEIEQLVRILCEGALQTQSSNAAERSFAGADTAPASACK